MFYTLKKRLKFEKQQQQQNRVCPLAHGQQSIPSRTAVKRSSFSVQLLPAVTNPKAILGKVAQMKSPREQHPFHSANTYSTFLWLHPEIWYPWEPFHLCLPKLVYCIPDCNPLSSPSLLLSSSHSNSCHLLGQHPLLALFFQSTRLLDFTISKLEHNHSPAQCLIPSSSQ